MFVYEFHINLFFFKTALLTIKKFFFFVQWMGCVSKAEVKCSQPPKILGCLFHHQFQWNLVLNFFFCADYRNHTFWDLKKKRTKIFRFLSLLNIRMSWELARWRSFYPKHRWGKWLNEIKKKHTQTQKKLQSKVFTNDFVSDEWNYIGFSEILPRGRKHSVFFIFFFVLFYFSSHSFSIYWIDYQNKIKKKKVVYEKRCMSKHTEPFNFVENL